MGKKIRQNGYELYASKGSSNIQSCNIQMQKYGRLREEDGKIGIQSLTFIGG